MIDYILVAVIVLIAAVGIRSTIRHFVGRGGCCGGGDYRPKKKKLNHILYTRTFVLEGMHCANCKARVEEIINDMQGVAGQVDLKKCELTVSYAEAVDDAQIEAGLARAGYSVVGRKSG